jgi:hypothetical protein
MLADGDSLILSVVPKALLEMSRKQMRETFSSIICKRIYTLNFDRGSEVTPSISQSLSNAKRNRGVVVATPTTIKAFQLVYIETIQLLEEARKLELSDKVATLKTKLVELRSILATFRESILLLDEVDLVLHPLKSELNFPIGEKFALEGSDHGERWNLPMHLIDAIFYDQTKRITTFETSTTAIEIMNELSRAIQIGYEKRTLQRLPHFTLLDINFYNESLKPILAEWAYLWLQKQHLHGIDKKDVIEYILEGAVARTDLSLKVKLLQAAIDRIQDIEEANSPTTRSKMQFKPSLVRQNSFDAGEDSHSMDDVERERRCLMFALDEADTQRRLISDIFSVENELETHIKSVQKRTLELSKESFSLKQEIDTLNCPRDNSLDNDTIVWVSVEFLGGSNLDTIGGLSSMESGAASVQAISDVLEEKGYKIKRLGDAMEAIKRARELKENKRLRAVIFGGGEAPLGCGKDCQESHSQSIPCLVCRHPYGRHSGHSCRDGRRGSFRSGRASAGLGGDSEKKLNMTANAFFSQLTLMDDQQTKEIGLVPPTRCVLYGGNTVTKDNIRSSLWNLQVNLLELPGDMCSFIESQKAWEVRESEEVKAEDEDDLDSKTAARIDKCSSRLSEVEKAQAKLIEDDEEERKRLNLKAKELKKELDKSVLARKTRLDDTREKLTDILTKGGVDVQDITAGKPRSGRFSGPRSGRDAALAEAWLFGLRADAIESPSEKTIRRAQRAMKWLGCEYESLRQVTLAGSVVMIPSPEHIKFLNLTHDWLRTFLPHCLQKVNRVSFGLLSSEECVAVLDEDPNMPRSRLALAVPFIGKDVPSKSSEFAHPDITIGLTIMGYRYSGLRQNDFNDLIDHITVSYKNEIGAPRERISSIRYESWVGAAGGIVRGVDMSKISGASGSASSPAQSSSSRGGDSVSNLAAGGRANDADTPALLSLASKEKKRNDAELEVIQLKFLQKSNNEQIEKIQNLWNYEPLALHYYLNKFIFPEHMRTQVKKLQASGQSVGGDMIVGRRVGFSGTPSDLLPLELGSCQYETGDDGKMLTTVLDPTVVSYERLIDNWSVESLLNRLATSQSPRFNALIDAGALITGYSNQQVAEELLKRGLNWCEGVIFLDNQDRQQVLVRATNRVISADQCGVPLDKRFAFYDQIHTTGIDIKHVVNATAVITLGKDNVFRDYVQGAFRMRGIGNGQKIHVFIIPEVMELIEQTKAAASVAKQEEVDVVAPLAEDDILTIPSEFDNLGGPVYGFTGSSERPSLEVHETESAQSSSNSALSTHSSVGVDNSVLKDIVAWLVVQSMRSEQTQWSMLCIQNIANIYRKPAFDVLLQSAHILVAGGLMNSPIDASSADKKLLLSPKSALAVFEETIDFSLEATVPDPIPFATKLTIMREENQAFILTEEAEQDAEKVMADVASHSMEEAGANKFEAEQEREQEQEQQKEVQARRDQQIEIEKFVDREYSRNEEKPTPWHISALLNAPSSTDHPFYPLSSFALRHQDPVSMPSQMYCSKNYFNPKWTGLRRIKNVIMVMEWSPSIDALRLLDSQEHSQRKLAMTEERMRTFEKSFRMISQDKDFVTRQEFELLVRALTDSKPSERVITKLLENENEQNLTFDRVVALFQSGRIHPAYASRHYVAVSLAEAETLRRILHVKRDVPLIGKAQVALRYSPLPSQGSSKAGDCGVIFDSTPAWKRGTNATAIEAAEVHNAFRYFDGDMHYSDDRLSALIRGLQRSLPSDREKFFTTTVGVRRRLERKWQETPLSKVFTLVDDLAMLKQRAQAIFIREALKKINLKKWEAFNYLFDSDGNGLISGAELYGALMFLKMPGVDADEVVDFMDANDMNRDNCLDYKEFADAITDIDRIKEDDEEEEAEEGDDANEEKKENAESSEPFGSKTIKGKIDIEPYGIEEIRKVVIRRMKEDVERKRVDRINREVMASEMEAKIFEEELKAATARLGRANPSFSTDEGMITTEYSFTSNSNPLRTVNTSGKFKIMNEEKIRDKLKKHVMKCPNNHPIKRMGHTTHRLCGRCAKPKPNQPIVYASHVCEYSKSKGFTDCGMNNGFYLCDRCVKVDEEDRLKAATDPAKIETYASLECGSCLSVQIPQSSVSAQASQEPSSISSSSISSSSLSSTAIISGISFTILAEIMLPTLPIKGQRAALLRFSPHNMQAAGKFDRRQLLASMYVNSRGEVGGPDLPALGLDQDQVSDAPTSTISAVPATTDVADEAASINTPRKKVRIEPKRWTTIAVCIDAGNRSNPRASFYVDGEYASSYLSDGSGESNLSFGLGRRIVLFGGGKDVETNGGCLRKVFIVDGLLDKKGISRYLAHNPVFRSAAVKIQSAMRMKLSKMKFGDLKEEQDGKAAGVRKSKQSKQSGQNSGNNENIGDFNCPICCADYSKSDVNTLPCSHTFCYSCLFEVYSHASNKSSVKCPQHKCNMIITPSDLANIVNKMKT